MLKPQIVYQADVTNYTDDTYKYCLRLAETSFKDRYRNHISSFNDEQQKILTQNCLNKFGLLKIRMKLK